MSYEPWIALRYLRAKRTEKFISVTTLFSIGGVAVGVMALIVVLGVMSGFEHTLKEKIVGVNPHIIVEPHRGVIDMQQLSATLGEFDEIDAYSPFVQGQGLVRKSDYVHGVLVWGIDPVREKNVTQMGSYLDEGQLNDLVPGSIIIGSQLAAKMGLFMGDTVELVSPFKKKPHEVKVAGIFSSGMYEYDLSLVLISLAEAQEFFKVPGLVSGIGIKLHNIDDAPGVASRLKDVLFGYRIRTWMDANSNLFSAIKIEKMLMFIILTLIIMVGGLNIVSTLVMMVMEKTKDIGILKVLGATNASIARIFMIKGIVIGCLGTCLGAAGGLGAAMFLEQHPLPLPANLRDIYYTDHLPVFIEPSFVIIISLAAFCITLLATVYPALRAAGLRPVNALRYE